MLDPLLAALRSRQIASYLPPHVGVVADMGCGYDARLLQALASHGRLNAGYGLDVSVREFPPGHPIRTMSADLNDKLPLASESVDAVTSVAVLEHLADPRRHLAEIHRVVRRGGVLVLTTPTVSARPVLEFISFRLHLIDATEIKDHKHYFTREELLELVADVGFDPEQCRHEQFSFGFNQILVCVKSA